MYIRRVRTRATWLVEILAFYVRLFASFFFYLFVYFNIYFYYLYFIVFIIIVILDSCDIYTRTS
jgi:hypothetical protein